jgi:hypothetical protein
MAKENQPKTATFKFVKTHDYKNVGVTGAFGGITVRGDININFYLDVVKLPPNTVHAVEQNGIIGEEQVRLPDPEFVREVPFGINIDVNTAKSIVVWMNSKIKDAEAHISKHSLGINKKTDDSYSSSK